MYIYHGKYIFIYLLISSYSIQIQKRFMNELGERKSTLKEYYSRYSSILFQVPMQCNQPPSTHIAIDTVGHLNQDISEIKIFFIH